MTYATRSTQLALDAEIAVYVLCDADMTNIELLPLKPRSLPDSEVQALNHCWTGRELRGLGVIGIVKGAPHVALKELLGVEQIAALSAAFVTYVNTLIAVGLEQEREGIEVQELCRLWSLGSPYPYSEA